MGDAQDMYEHAMRETGIDDPAEALDSLISGYGREESYQSDYDESNEYDEIEYDIGDTVRLYSGGPLMTIKEVRKETYLCRWFNKNDDLNSSEFHKDEIYYDSEPQSDNNSSPKNTNVNVTSIPELDISVDEIPF